mmetsp:Transcript_53035/g.60775  ORF Transcript_53035/g.60775 Transcript_53035/m.60775 type:complete len:339 (-) Transcript_53035:703-1719(-)
MSLSLFSLEDCRPWESTFNVNWKENRWIRKRRREKERGKNKGDGGVEGEILIVASFVTTLVVKGAFNLLGYGLNVSSQFLFNREQTHSVIFSNEVDGQTQMSESTRSTNSMQVGFSGSGEIEVNNNIDRQDIDTTSEQIRGNQTSRGTISEVMENFISVLLLHLGVNIEAGVSEFSDLFGQQFYTVGGVTEYYTLVNLQLGEEGVQAMNLLLFFDESIVLGNTLQSEFFHQIDCIGIGQILVLELLDSDGESSRVQQNLATGRHVLDKSFNDFLELLRQQFIGFVHDQHFTVRQVGNIFVGQIQDSSGSSDKNVDRLVQSNNIITKGGSSGGHHALNV